MTQSSYPKGAASEAALGEREWQQIMRSVGRGILDEGGNPYWLTNRDSVTDTVTIGVDTREGYAAAILDGFLHFMDAPETLSVPPVSTDTVYEVGLVFDPNGVADPVQGPITLTVWKAPADDSGGKSHMPFWRITRKANVALGSSAYEEVRPRCSSVLTVTRKSDLPTSGVVLSDTIALVRTEAAFYRSAVSSGTVQWIGPIGGSTDIEEATHLVEPGKLIRRWSGNGTVHMPDPIAPADAANKRYVDGKTIAWDSVTGKPSSYWPSVHSHTAAVIESGEFDNARVKGSSKAYSNTNVGSTWASVVATTSGNFGRYPSALKYKKNVRTWSVNPDTVYGLTPVKYEDTQNGDTRVGFVADSYINTLPEMVELDPETGAVEGWKYMLTCVAQQVAIRDLNERLKTAETALTGLLERVADLETGAL